MTDDTVRVELRYRPGPDVLSGEVALLPLGDSAAVTESPDADSSFVWSGGRYLSSFQLVHASSRLANDDACAPLPICLVPVARQLVTAALEALAEHDSPMARLRARAQSTTNLPLSALQRAVVVRSAAPVADAAITLALSTSLARLSAAIHQQVPADEQRARHTDRFSQLLLELAVTVAHGAVGTAPGTAPGTSAATRAALADTLPLTGPQQQALRDALRELDDPQSWRHASETFQLLAQQLEHSSS